jgi:hypothetical protein
MMVEGVGGWGQIRLTGMPIKDLSACTTSPFDIVKADSDLLLRRRRKGLRGDCCLRGGCFEKMRLNVSLGGKEKFRSHSERKELFAATVHGLFLLLTGGVGRVNANIFSHFHPNLLDGSL